MLKQRFINRVNSDRADSNSVSIILWIVLTVVLVLTVGGIIFNAVKSKADDVGACIKNSDLIIGQHITGAVSDTTNC